MNLFGAYWMAQAAARSMRRGGSIVNLGSVLAYKSGGLPQAAYASSKSALLGLTTDLAQQWSGRKGIRVNTLVPGWFPTEITDAQEPGSLEALAARTPLGRLGRVHEAAAAAVFLASDASSYMTGSAVVVDGGFLSV